MLIVEHLWMWPRVGSCMPFGGGGPVLADERSRVAELPAGGCTLLEDVCADVVLTTSRVARAACVGANFKCDRLGEEASCGV